MITDNKGQRNVAGVSRSGLVQPWKCARNKALSLSETLWRVANFGAAEKVCCAFQFENQCPWNTRVLGMLDNVFGTHLTRAEPRSGVPELQRRVSSVKVAKCPGHLGFKRVMRSQGGAAGAPLATTNNGLNGIQVAFDAVALEPATETLVTRESATAFEQASCKTTLSTRVGAVQANCAQVSLPRQLLDDEVFVPTEQAIGSIKETPETKQMVCPLDPTVIAQQIARLRGDACPGL